jgi:hypothetical protein
MIGEDLVFRNLLKLGDDETLFSFIWDAVYSCKCES